MWVNITKYLENTNPIENGINGSKFPSFPVPELYILIVVLMLNSYYSNGNKINSASICPDNTEVPSFLNIAPMFTVVVYLSTLNICVLYINELIEPYVGTRRAILVISDAGIE